ncbi:MAG: hypothetical protein ACRC62_32035 [Microcoleus sp.]
MRIDNSSGRARGHRPYQLSTQAGGHGSTAPTNSQLSTLNSQLSTQICQPNH